MRAIVILLLLVMHSAVVSETAWANHAVRAPALNQTGFLPLRSGGCGYFEVFSDPPGCIAATITAQSLNPTVFQVYAVDGFGNILPGQDGVTATVNNVENQKFKVVAAEVASVLTGTVRICWDEAGASGCMQTTCPGFAASVTVQVLNDPATRGANPEEGIAGDPIGTRGGEFFLLPKSYLSLGGSMGLELSIYWAARIRSDNNIFGRIGIAWLHNFDWAFKFPDISGDNIIEIHTPRGRVIRFEKSFFEPGWRLTPYEDIPFQIAQSGGDYVLADPRDGHMYTFDVLSASAGRLVLIEDGKGNSLSISYDGSGRVSQVSDGLGRTLTYGYTGNSLTSVTDGTRTVTLAYSGGRLTTVTNAMGGVTSFSYDVSDLAKPQVTGVTLPRGNAPFTQAYDSQKRVVSQADAFGNTYTYSYNAATGETTIIDPLGNTRIQDHAIPSLLPENQPLLDESRDEAAQSVTFDYDEKGRRVQATDRLGATTTLSYHEPTRCVQTITDAEGGSTTLTRSARAVAPAFTLYDVTSVQRADGTTQSLTYDAQGNVLSRTDPAGNVTTFTYDGRGQVLTIGNAEGGATSYAYYADGTLASAADPAGNTTLYSYDALRRLVAITRPDGATSTATYDALDRVLSSTDEIGAVTTYAYDANGNVTSITTPLGAATTYTYDAMDRLVTRTDETGGTTTITYDAMGRPASATDANGSTRSITYDSRGRVASAIDGGGNAWLAAYDDEGVLAQQTNPLGASTSYETDNLGRVTRTTSPLGAATDATFAALGRLLEIDNALGQTTRFDRDANGNASRIELVSDGAQCSYARNGLQQVASATDSRGGVWQNGFDSQGRRTSRTDPLGRTTLYVFNARSQRVLEIHPGGLGSTSIARDAAGRVTSRTSTDGTSVSYAYDAAGRLTAGTGPGGSSTFAYDAAGRVTQSNGVTMTYDAGGRLSSMTLAPSRTVAYGYDSRDLLTSVTDWVGGATTFTYDTAGRLLTIARPNGVTTSRTYDADGRLVAIVEQAGAPLSSIALTRNVLGEITRAVRDTPLGGPPAATNQPASFDAANQPTAQTYDAMGRLVSDGSRSFTWNLESRLTSIDTGGNAVTFAHDAFGNVVSRIENGQTDEYVWNYALPIPSIVVALKGGAPQRFYLVGANGGLLHSVDVSDNSRRFYHFDEMGSTSFLTDDAGAVAASYAYAPFGALVAQSGATPGNPFTFHGRMGVVQEGPLYVMRARVYDPSLGRFVSRDPVETLDPRNVNPYQALYGNPLDFADPLGTKIPLIDPMEDPGGTLWELTPPHLVVHFLEEPRPLIVLDGASRLQPVRESSLTHQPSVQTIDMRGVLLRPTAAFLSPPLQSNGQRAEVVIGAANQAAAAPQPIAAGQGRYTPQLAAMNATLSAGGSIPAAGPSAIGTLITKSAALFHSGRFDRPVAGGRLAAGAALSNRPAGQEMLDLYLPLCDDDFLTVDGKPMDAPQRFPLRARLVLHLISDPRPLFSLDTPGAFVTIDGAPQ